MDRPMRIIDAICETLHLEMQRDERIVVLGEDVGKKGGVFRATYRLPEFGIQETLLERFGEERVIDTPLAESGIIGCAIGMALGGLIPIAEIQFADFIHPAFNQIVSEAARMRYRSQGAFGLPIVIRAPYGWGKGGGIYHCQSVEAFFAHVPGLTVVIPSNSYDAKGLLSAAIRNQDPVLFFEPKSMYSIRHPFVCRSVPEHIFTCPLQKAEIVREGNDITIVAYGAMLFESWKATELLEKDGIDVELIDIKTLKPLDSETIFASVKKTGRILVVYEDNRFLGYGAEILAQIGETHEIFECLDAPPARFAGPDVPAVPYAYTLENEFMPNAEKIAAAVRDLAAY